MCQHCEAKADFVRGEHWNYNFKCENGRWMWELWLADGTRIAKGMLDTSYYEGMNESARKQCQSDAFTAAIAWAKKNNRVIRF